MDRKTEMEAVSLGLTGVANARRVAGYPAAGGRKVRGERLLRTGALGGASAEDLQRLIRYQVKYVVDFRTSFEKAGAPDPEIPGAVHLDIPILEESGDSAAGAAAAGGMADPAKAILQYALSGKLENLYLDMAMSAFSQQGFKRFFDLLLDCREGAVLWHCTGGKDRTCCWTAGKERSSGTAPAARTGRGWRDICCSIPSGCRKRTVWKISFSPTAFCRTASRRWTGWR